MPNKLIQFWQELKRRNVVRVITVYAASAFVVLELVDIIEGVVKVRLKGACAGCPGATMTMKMGIERILKEKVPEVKEVIAVD